MTQPKRDKYSTNHNIKYGYVRIGIYFPHRVSKQIHAVNFCDLHFAGPLLSGSKLEGSYSGARKSIAQIKGGNHAYRMGIRTPEDEKKLLESDDVDERNRLSNGGRAALLLNQTRNIYECWLFGPLWFGPHRLGSLLLKLSGLRFPRMMTRHAAPDKDDVHWLEAPAGFPTSRGLCTLWGSYYSGVHQNTINDTVPDLLKQRKHVFPIDVATPHSWKVEAYFDNLTVDQARHQRDTTRHKFVYPGA